MVCRQHRVLRGGRLPTARSVNHSKTAMSVYDKAIGGHFNPFPSGKKVHVIFIGRASPSTINDGSCQRAYCRAGIELLDKQGFFPSGYLYVETAIATKHSGYKTHESHSLFEVVMYITRNPGATFLVVASNIDRFGSDWRNIQIFLGIVKAFDKDCCFLSLRHFGFKMDQIQELTANRQIARDNVNQRARDEMAQTTVCVEC